MEDEVGREDRVRPRQVFGPDVPTSLDEPLGRAQIAQIVRIVQIAQPFPILATA